MALACSSVFSVSTAVALPTSHAGGATQLRRVRQSLSYTSARVHTVRAEGEATADAPPAKPKLAKGAVVRVDKEKYLSSIEFKAVDHPPYFKGLDYIYEPRGEVLDIRDFDGQDFALVTWVGIPTAPAWLSVDLLVKEPKLKYQRI